jgi:hypothetical protein
VNAVVSVAAAQVEIGVATGIGIVTSGTGIGTEVEMPETAIAIEGATVTEAGTIVTEAGTSATEAGTSERKVASVNATAARGKMTTLSSARNVRLRSSVAISTVICALSSSVK